MWNVCVGGNEADAVWLLDVCFELASYGERGELFACRPESPPQNHTPPSMSHAQAEAGPMQGGLWSCGGLCEGCVGLALQKEAGKSNDVVASRPATARSRQDWTCHENLCLGHT